MTSIASTSYSHRKRKRPSLPLPLALVEDITASVTLGAHPLVKRVIASSLEHLSATPISATTATTTTSTSPYLPDIDVTSYLKYLRTAPKERAKAEDLERWRTDPIDLDDLLLLPGNQPSDSFLPTKPIATAVSAAMQPLDSTTLQPDMVSNVLEVNRSGILELKKLKDETALGCEHSAAVASNLAFGLRRRLLQLSFQVPKSEVTSRIQSTLPSSLPVSQSPVQPGKPPSLNDTRLLPDSSLKPVSGRGNLINPRPGATVISSTSALNTPGVSSMSPPPLSSLDQLAFVSAQAGLPRCANCLTTDTPGWRAGEKPDVKLCNACGLYWAKNNSHRPPELWGSGKNIRRPHENCIT